MVMIEYWLSDNTGLSELIDVENSTVPVSWRAELMIKKITHVDEYIIVPDQPQTLSEMVGHMLQELVKHRGGDCLDAGFRAWHAE